MSVTMPKSEMEHQLAHIDDNHQPQLIAYFTILLVASIISVVARLVSRKVKGLKFGADDYTITLALVFLISNFACDYLYIAAGLGRHVLANKPWQAKLGTRINYPANITYTITWPLIKISILFLYRRIFFVVHRFKQYINVFIAVLFSYLFSTLFVDIFICWPVSKVWNPSLEGKCLDYLKLFYATASLNVFFDVLILASPMPLVWRLNATLKLKLGLSFIFILGGLTCVCSAMRLATFKHINEWDNTWTYIQSDYWIVAELCLSVICACVPTMRPLWLNVVSLYRRSRSRGSDNLSDKPPTGQNTAKSYPFRREISNPAAVHSPTSPSHSRTFSPTRHGFARLSDDYIGYQHGRGGVVQEDTIWEERLANKDGKEVRVHVDV